MEEQKPQSREDIVARACGFILGFCLVGLWYVVRGGPRSWIAAWYVGGIIGVVGGLIGEKLGRSIYRSMRK